MSNFSSARGLVGEKHLDWCNKEVKRADWKKYLKKVLEQQDETSLSRLCLKPKGTKNLRVWENYGFCDKKIVILIFLAFQNFVRAAPIIQWREYLIQYLEPFGKIWHNDY